MKKVKLPIYAALYDTEYVHDSLVGWIHSVGYKVNKGKVDICHPMVEIHLLQKDKANVDTKVYNYLTFAHENELDIFIKVLQEASVKLKEENKKFYQKEKEFYDKKEKKVKKVKKVSTAN